MSTRSLTIGRLAASAGVNLETVRYYERIGLMPAPARTDGETAAVVLMGDFNTGPETAPYRRILASGLRDARAVSPVVFGPAGTFNGFDIAADNEGVAIDRGAIRARAVERFGVLTDSFGGRVISDHFPVVADLVPVGP